jgi:hypothetical protein
MVFKNVHAIPQHTHVRENEREVWIVRDRFDPFERVQQMGPVFMIRREYDETLFIRRRP